MTRSSFNDTESAGTEAILQRFNDVFLSHDPAALPDLVADDCVIENTQPAPDGSRHEGKKACIELWTQIATNPGIRFEPEGIIARGNRGEIRWRPIWGPDHASSVRGVNLMRTFATGGSSRPKATSRARDSSQFKQSLVLSAAQSADRARSCVTPS